MGSCCTKSSDSKKNCCFCCCRCCFASNVKDDDDVANRSKELPEARTTVETYDFTAEHRRRSKLDESTTATSFMTFSLNNDHPTDLDRKAAIGNTTENQPCYVRLDCADEVAMGLRRLSVKQHKTLDIPEEATRL